MNRYYVRMTKSFRGPSKVALAITVGDQRAMVAFNKHQEDKTATDYPSKTIWLKDEVALDLKAKGFDVRKAKPPKKKTVQEKPKRETEE